MYVNLDNERKCKKSIDYGLSFLNDVKVLWIRSDISKVANMHTILIENIECEFKDYFTILKRERFYKPFHKFAIRIGGNGVHAVIPGA